MTKRIEDEKLAEVAGGAIDLEQIRGPRGTLLRRLRAGVQDPPGGGRGPVPEASTPAGGTPDFNRGSDD